MRRSVLLIVTLLAVSCGRIGFDSDTRDSAPEPDASEIADAATGGVQLSIVIAGDAAGTVTSSPAGIACPGTCSASFMPGETITLTAGGPAYGWDNAPCLDPSTCSLAIAEDTSVSAWFLQERNLVFLTSTTARPDLFASAADVDSHCNTSAQAAGLPGTYVAWYSDSTADAIDRLGTARGWMRVDGRPFADSVADLVAGQVLHPALFSELGDALTLSFPHVATATLANGRLSANNCETTAKVTIGVTDGTSDFTNWLSSDCAVGRRYLCLGVDYNRAIPELSPLARKAFLSDAGWTPSGLSSADTLCQGEATASGLEGSYRALLATSSAASISRFDTGGAPWVRLDGVPLAPTAAEFAVGNVATTLSLTPSGIYTSADTWHGADTPAELATGLSCSDWESTAGWGTAGTVGSLFGVFSSGTVPCTFARRLYCLQQ